MRIIDWSSDVCSSDLTRQFDPVRTGTEGSWLGWSGHGEPPAPCYPRLLPRGPLPRAAVARQRRCRRHLPRRDAMNRLAASFLAVAVASLCWMLPATPATAQQPLQPLDTIVAVVDEDVILRSDLDLAMANPDAQFADRRDRPQERRGGTKCVRKC